MNIFVTSYGLDIRYPKAMKSYPDIIKLLTNKRVAMIVNAKLITEDRATARIQKEELIKNKIEVEIIDLNNGQFVIEHYDALYFTGGEPKYLMDAIINNHYYDLILDFIKKGRVIVGQSAGAMILAKNYADTTTKKLLIRDNGFALYFKTIIPHYNHLPKKIKDQLPADIYKVIDNSPLIKLDI